MSNGESTNPYVGPVPYSIEKKDFFFGRDEEAENLLSLAISERIVLFFAQSGAGKSSLVNASLIPELEKKKYKVLPVARVGGELPENIPVDKIDNIFVFNTLLSLAEGKKGLFSSEIKKDAKAQIGKSLTDYVREQKLVEEDKQHWLVIDQFEEIITTHPSQDLEKRKDFFRQLKQMLNADPLLSLVLVMREDHLAGLSSFAPLLPGRLGTPNRIERLRRKEAEQAVRLPARKAGREFEAGAVENLVRDLSQQRIADQEVPGPGEYVEPLFLQVVCFNLWNRLDQVKSEKTPEADKIITKKDVEAYGNIDQALQQFYHDAVVRVAEGTGTSEGEIRRWFGEKLIAPSGIRAQVNRELFKSGGLSNTAVDQLLGKEHLIRLEEARGGKWYELAHDRFIKPVQDSNEEYWTRGGGDSRLARTARLWNRLNRDESFLYRGRVLEHAQARYEKNKESVGPLEIEFLNASVNAQSKRSRLYGSMIGALVFMLLLAFASAGYAFYKKSDSDKHWKELVQLNTQIEQQRKEEKGLREWAERDNSEANKQLGRAKEQFKVAESERNKAEDQRKRAESAQNAEKRLRLQAQQRERILKDLERRNTVLRAAEQKDYESELLDLEKQTALLSERTEFLMRFLTTTQFVDYQRFVQSQTSEQTRPAQRLPGCDVNGICTSNLAVVGEVRWKVASAGGFEFLEDWSDRNITQVEIPELSGLRTFGTTFDGKVQFFKGAAAQLQKAWAEIGKASLLDQVNSWDGSLTIGNYKPPRPSSHSVGTAFDIKVNRSPGDKPLSKDDKVSKLLQIFIANGFRPTTIGMGAYHVEYVGTNRP